MRRHWFTLRFTVGLCGFLLATLPAVCQRFSVTGRVLHEEDMRPAEMVTVALRNFTGMGFEQANTDVHGYFRFSVPRGVYYLNIRIPDYAEVNERVEVGVFSSDGIMLYLRRLPDKKSASFTMDAAAPPVAAEYLKIPASARDEYEKGMKLFHREGRLGDGLVHLRKAVELFPQFALAHYGMGMLLMDLDRLDEAKDSFLRAITENDKLVPAYFPLGAIYNQRREFAEAEKVLRRGLQVKETIWQFHFELGRAVAYQGRWEEAEKIARRAAELNAAAAKVRLLLANIYFELGKDDLALAEAEEFLKLAPDDPVAPQIRTQVEAMRSTKKP